MERVRNVTGMPFFRYAKNKCWTMSDEEIERLNARIIEEKKANVQKIVAATGWVTEKAEKALATAYERGLSGKTYIENKLYLLDENELDDFAAAYKAQRRLAKRKAEVKEATGWTDEQVDDAFSKASDLDITSKVFTEKGLYALSDEELREYAVIKDGLKRQAAANTEFYIDIVCKRTGWDRNFAAAQMDEAKGRGISNLKYVEKEYWLNDNAMKGRVGRFLKKDKKRVSSRVESYVQKIMEATGWTRAIVYQIE
jgi:hypothetical protein